MLKDALPIQRALGLKWNMESDKFKFDRVLKDKPTTRRGILSLVSSVYDPLGFLAPVVLPAKKLFQDLCREKLAWDDPIGAVERERWEDWKKKMPNLAGIAVNRCLKPINFVELKYSELHIFADASQFAYGAVSSLRMVDSKATSIACFSWENLAWPT